MIVSVFSARQHDRTYLERARTNIGLNITFDYHEVSLSSDTVQLAKGSTAVCVFVNDILNAVVLKQLHNYEIGAILLRCAGYNNVDLESASNLGFFIANVPSYSPESVAEFAVALIQTLNRKTYKAYNRVRVGNFSLDGLLGFTLHGKTVGIIGTGRIGLCFARIMSSFGCRILAYDPFQPSELLIYGKFVELNVLLKESDIVSLHCPLIEGTKHIINNASLARMKAGAMLVNVSRGGLIDTEAAIECLKRKHLGSLAMDVYEQEGKVFYEDHSADIVEDDTLMRLMTFPNVIITGHQAFFTEEALTEIAGVTLQNLSHFQEGLDCSNNLLLKGSLDHQKTNPVRI